MRHITAMLLVAVLLLPGSTQAGMPASRPSAPAAGTAVDPAQLLDSANGAADEAVEIRTSNVFYRADLTRAYTPCLAPNDVASDGTPACSPPVTSACTFGDGRIRLGTDPPLATTETRLVVTLSDVGGPSPCDVGPYTLDLALRVTADDPACASGRCTFEDVASSVPLVASESLFYDFFIDTLLETALAGARGGSNYEVLHATILGPDGLPVATAGLRPQPYTNLITNMSAGYEACTTPDTNGALGAACSAPQWASVCDFNDAVVAWRGRSSKVSVEPRVSDLAGLSPLCASGTYQLESTVRITRNDCAAGMCTLIDRSVVIPVGARGGEIGDVTYPLFETTDVDRDSLSIELRGVRILDPLGNLLATSAVSSALRLSDPVVLLLLRDMADPSDDRVNLRAKLPLLEIDPTEDPGVTFTVTDRVGLIYKVLIPAALWQSSVPGTQWTFTDKLGTINGVRKAMIKRVTQLSQPPGYRLKILAKQASLSTTGFPGVNLLVTVPRIGGAGVVVAQRNRTCRSKSTKLTCR